MKRTIWFWIFAILITIASAVYQRITGPTYPVSGKKVIYEREISFKLDRSHSGNSNHQVKIQTNDPSFRGVIFWKRYKTNDNWTKVEMHYSDGYLVGELPWQPPAGKLIYNVNLKKENLTVRLNENPVVIRFRGDVPMLILILHIIFIFSAMLLSTRTGFEVFSLQPKLKKYTLLTVVIMFIGGLVLGPIVQNYSFGAYWTGFPFGYDLTDNKTLIAFIGWLVALIAIYKFSKPRWWILFASIMTFIIFLIPHSVLGSELDYNKIDKEKSKIESIK